MLIRHDRWHRINGRRSRCSTGRDHRGCVQVGTLEGAPPVVAAFGHQVDLLEAVLKEKPQQLLESQNEMGASMGCKECAAQPHSWP